MQREWREPRCFRAINDWGDNYDIVCRGVADDDDIRRFFRDELAHYREWFDEDGGDPDDYQRLDDNDPGRNRDAVRDAGKDPWKDAGKDPWKDVGKDAWKDAGRDAVNNKIDGAADVKSDSGATRRYQRHQFDRFVLESSSVTSLGDDVIDAAQFRVVVIKECPGLASISLNAFRPTRNITEEVSVEGCPSLTNVAPRDYQPFDFGSQFVAAKSVRLARSKLVSVPTDAFRPLFGRQHRLMALDLHGNNIMSIGKYAFFELPNLARIDLSGNRLSAIGLAAFVLQQWTHQPALLRIDLSGNFLKAASFHKEALLEIGRPFDLDLSGNQIAHLDEDVFRPLFVREVSIRMWQNPISCGCRLKWITEQPQCARGVRVWDPVRGVESDLNFARYVHGIQCSQGIRRDERSIPKKANGKRSIPERANGKMKSRDAAETRDAADAKHISLDAERIDDAAETNKSLSNTNGVSDGSDEGIVAIDSIRDADGDVSANRRRRIDRRLVIDSQSDLLDKDLNRTATKASSVPATVSEAGSDRSESNYRESAVGDRFDKNNADDNYGMNGGGGSRLRRNDADGVEFHRSRAGKMMSRESRAEKRLSSSAEKSPLRGSSAVKPHSRRKRKRSAARNGTFVYGRLKQLADHFDDGDHYDDGFLGDSDHDDGDDLLNGDSYHNQKESLLTSSDFAFCPSTASIWAAPGPGSLGLSGTGSPGGALGSPGSLSSSSLTNKVRPYFFCPNDELIRQRQPADQNNVFGVTSDHKLDSRAAGVSLDRFLTFSVFLWTILQFLPFLEFFHQNFFQHFL